MKTLLSLFFAMICATSGAITMTGNLQTITGSSATTTFRLQPLTAPLGLGGVLVAGATQTFTATNGTFSISLTTGNYRFSVGQYNFNISVPSNSNTYNVTELIASGFAFTSTPGLVLVSTNDTTASNLVAKLIFSTGLVATTNNPGGNESLTVTAPANGSNILANIDANTNQFSVSSAALSIKSGPLITNILARGITTDLAPLTNTLSTASRVAVFGASKQLTNAQASIAEIDYLVGFPELLTVSLSNKVDESSGVLTNASHYTRSAFFGPVAISNAAPVLDIFETGAPLNAKWWRWSMSDNELELSTVADNGGAGGTFLEFVRSGSTPSSMTLNTPINSTYGGTFSGGVTNTTLTAVMSVVTDANKKLISGTATAAEIAFLSGLASNLQATVNILNTALLNRVDENDGIATNLSHYGTITNYGALIVGTNVGGATTRKIVSIGQSTSDWSLVGADRWGDSVSKTMRIGALNYNTATNPLEVIQGSSSSSVDRVDIGGGTSTIGTSPGVIGLHVGVKGAPASTTEEITIDSSGIYPGVDAIGSSLGLSDHRWTNAFIASGIRFGSSVWDNIGGGTGDPELNRSGSKGALYPRESTGLYIKTVDSIGGNTARGWLLIPMPDYISNKVDNLYGIATNLYHVGNFTNQGAFYQTNATGSATNTFSSKSQFRANTEWTNALLILTYADSALSSTTPGTAFGGFHINPQTGTDGNMVGLTFGANSGGTPIHTSAQAGLYSQSSGAYGTRIGLANTDSFGTGSKMRLWIMESGKTGINTNAATEMLHVHGNSKIVNGFLQMSQITTNSIPETDSARFFVKDVGGTAEMFALDEAGNAVQLTAHNMTGPSFFYDSDDDYKAVRFEFNFYLGKVKYRNEGRKNKLLKLVMDSIADGTNYLSGLSNNKKKTEISETFDEYNTRLGYTNGHPARLVQWNWQTNQNNLQIAYDLGRSNELWQVSRGDTTITVRPAADIRKPIPAQIQ